jgi:hypothetical protein
VGKRRWLTREYVETAGDVLAAVFSGIATAMATATDNPGLMGLTIASTVSATTSAGAKFWGAVFPDKDVTASLLPPTSEGPAFDEITGDPGPGCGAGNSARRRRRVYDTGSTSAQIE